MNLTMGEYVIMPNHFHAILEIGPNKYNCEDVPGIGDAMPGVSTQVAKSANVSKKGPQSKNLSSIIRGYKSAVTMGARRIDAGFAWQARFHDHIIRSDESHDRIAKYIQENPTYWQQDRYCM